MKNKTLIRRFKTLEGARIEQVQWGFLGSKMRARIYKSGDFYAVRIDISGTTSAPKI